MKLPNENMTKTPIIFINGTSSSGKSTLCHVLKEKLKAPFWRISSDHFMEAEMHPKIKFIE